MTLRMTAAWGSAAMLLAAMSVTSQPNRDQPNRDQPSTRTQPRTTLPGQTGLPTILNDMEGLWNVRITVNRDHWKMHKDSNRGPGQTTQPGRTGDQGTQPGRSGEEGTQPGRGGEQGNQPGGEGAEGLVQGIQMEGFSERKLILGNNVLEERCYIPDMAKIIDGERQAGDNPTMRIDNDTFEGLSLLSFSPEDGTYGIVFVDGKTGKMHYDTGQFDATLNRIVFEGKGHGADATTTTTPPARRDGTSPTPPAERRDGVGQQPGQDGMRHGMYENVRVVLEVLGPNQHQVTMYRMDSSSPISTVPGEPPSREPADRNQPNTPEQPGTEPWGPTTLASNIIYRATYTRAEGSQAAQYRDLIEESQVVTRGAEDEDTDR